MKIKLAIILSYLIILNIGYSQNGINFAPKVDFTTGGGPISVCAGDIDGDGKSDLAVVNSASWNLSILRNTSVLGTVSFASKIDFLTGNGPSCISIGDIDGDGKPDLVTANSVGSISVLRNTSTSGIISFAPKVDYTTFTTYNACIGDIDGDGKLDIVIANKFNNSVSVLRNTSVSGIISFLPKVDFATGVGPYSVTSGDLDGDGKPELAVTNDQSQTVSVLRNTSVSGNISFAAKVDFVTGITPKYPSIGDIDGDGNSDLIVTSTSSRTISVFRNISTQGTVNFESKIDFATGGTFNANPSSNCIGDLDGDGKPDIAVGSLATVSVHQNVSAPGTVNINPKINFGISDETFSVINCDLNGDTRPEIVATNQYSNTVSILKNKTPFIFLDLRFSLEAMFPVQDSIKVYLANSISPYARIDSSIMLSQLDVNKFKAQLPFANAVSGTSYYIIVKHRNSIETWSAAPVTFVNGSTSYDFTTSANMAYGNNMKLISASPDIFAIYSGDVNQDGTIDAGDLSQVENDKSNSLTGYVKSDVNGDNIIDASDVAVVENNKDFGVNVVTP